MECKHCGASFEGDICPYCRCKAEKPEPQIKEIMRQTEITGE